MTAKTLARRLLLGLGAAMLAAGLGAFIIGHETLHVVISFGQDDPAQRDKLLGLFKAGAVAFTLGAGLIGIALPRPTVRA
ncbi:MAG: hypothetical protein WC718_16215 [Phycisphaerales bacterium]|jgi:hypothetical protein